MMMTMDHTQEQRQLYQDSCKESLMIFSRNLKDDQNWDLIGKETCDSEKSSSIGEASMNSNGCSISSSLDTTDDASSSCSSSNSANSSGSLYDLSDLMSQLPIKRGLSKFYQGKSQSFTSLARVGSVEELAKKESAYNRRKSMKGCRSYGGSLNNYKSHTLPKPIISKKNSRGLVSSSSFSNRRGFKAPFV
ncbi:hypothetical protein DCAR_0730271 [Daucus carota subsp. sativus]|uniref:Oxidative stress 3 n=1 Tax=Daucus carota subsp. sativus TaxID=79200 RepID=A0AAF0XMK1_DAUCS|nr:PREDICTED: uncharacterized protein LOC108195196 [Daucus carota subsp. sativus]WOH10798.1 hypothetical protein DCAR_0730271 [Daucus carota subsp. sativus]